MKALSLVVLAVVTLSSSTSASTLGKNIKENSLIVYNGGIGLVHEKRTLNVKSGDTSIIYEGVANTIDTNSVNIKLSDSIELLSQQYRYDKITQTKLLNANIGKRVEVRVLKNRENFKIITATLLSYESGKCIVKTTDYKIISVNADDIILSDIPKELMTKPSLVWNIQVDENINSHIELDYIIKNISWRADYILNISKNSANLAGWMTIDNRSGKKFQNSNLKVLAGDLNYVRKSLKREYTMVRSVMMNTPVVKHNSHEGYHIYRVPFKVDLANNEKTQIKFIDKKNIHIQRKYSATLSRPAYFRGEKESSVTQSLTLNNLDIEIPKGIVRSYSKMDKQNILLGQTEINHTPKNRDINLVLGKNFDLKVTETIVSRDDTKDRYDAKIKYTLKNSADEDKTIEILVPFNKQDDSQIKTSQPYEVKKGNLISFNILVKANSTQEFLSQFISKR